MENKVNNLEKTEEPQALDRRNFLKVSSAAVVGAALSAPVLASGAKADVKTNKVSAKASAGSGKADGHRRAGWLAI